MRSVFILGGVASAAVLGYGFMRHILGVDPFASLRTDRAASSIAFEIRDVDMKHYRAGQLIGEAHADKVIVQSNKKIFDLAGITDGVFYSDEGRIDFTAEEAQWHSTHLKLMVTEGAQVKHEDFELRVPSFDIDRRASIIKVPGEMKGRLLDGTVAARDFTYNLKDRSYQIGPTTWVGNLQAEGQTERSRWTFQTDGGASSKGEIETWQKATATDGEVLVQGDVIERNKRTDVVTATGNVLYFSKKSNLACDKVVVYRKEKRAVLTGNVRMLIKPKDSMERELKVDTGDIPPFRPEVPDAVASTRPQSPAAQAEKELDEEIRSAKTTRKYPTVVLAEQIEYWYGEGNRKAVITGNPQARQLLAGERWRQTWTHRAVYDGENETLRLLSTDGKKDTRMKTSIGDDVKASWIELSTREGSDDWNGMGLEGVVYADDDEIPREEERQEAPSPQPPNGY